METKIATPLAFDKNGKPLHKRDTVMVDWTAYKDDTTFQFSDEDPAVSDSEVYDVVDPNKIVVICPFDDSLYVVESGAVEKNEAHLMSVPHLDNEAPIESQNEETEMGRARLMAPYENKLDQVADMLIELMRSVRKAVMPLQYKVSRIDNKKLAENGVVEDGVVGCEVQVSDYTMKRKGMFSVDLLVKNGEVQRPFFFRTSVGKHFPFTEAGFKKWLDIPLVPYQSKKNPSAEMAYNRD